MKNLHIRAAIDGVPINATAINSTGKGFVTFDTADSLPSGPCVLTVTLADGKSVEQRCDVRVEWNEWSEQMESRFYQMGKPVVTDQK